MVKRTHEITDKMEKLVYALFIEFTAGFDHVQGDLMFKVVCQRLTPTSNTKLIQLMEIRTEDTYGYSAKQVL